MLVLARKIGERIVIPDCNLTVTVLGVKGRTVRLGFSAPGEVEVYREEIRCRLCRESPSPTLKG